MSLQEILVQGLLVVLIVGNHGRLLQLFSSKTPIAMAIPLVATEDQSINVSFEILFMNHGIDPSDTVSSQNSLPIVTSKITIHQPFLSFILFPFLTPVVNPILYRILVVSFIDITLMPQSDHDLSILSDAPMASTGATLGSTYVYVDPATLNSASATYPGIFQCWFLP